MARVYFDLKNKDNIVALLYILSIRISTNWRR